MTKHFMSIKISNTKTRTGQTWKPANTVDHRIFSFTTSILVKNIVKEVGISLSNATTNQEMPL